MMLGGAESARKFWQFRFNPNVSMIMKDFALVALSLAGAS